MAKMDCYSGLFSAILFDFRDLTPKLIQGNVYWAVCSATQQVTPVIAGRQK